MKAKSKDMSNQTNLLDFMPNFLTGIKSLFLGNNREDLYDALLQRSSNDGLCSDWLAVGNDLRTAMDKFNSEMSWQKK